MSKGLEFRIREHAFWRMCSTDFNTARHIIKVINRHRRKDVRYYLMAALVVAYARPFSKNAGVGRSHQLGEKGIVPRRMRKLHDELIDRRNQQFAHIDLEYRNPRMVNWGTVDKPWFPMSFKGDQYELLDSRVREISELVKATEANLNARIDALEAEIAKAGEGKSYGSGPLSLT